MRRARQQSGYIYKRGGWWVLRYRDTVPENGHLVRRQMARQIEPVKPEHMRLKRPPQEIEDRAQTMLQPLNNHTYTPEAMQSIEQFVDGVYFPNLETQKRASTVRGYKARWSSQLKPYCGSVTSATIRVFIDDSFIFSSATARYISATDRRPATPFKVL